MANTPQNVEYVEERNEHINVNIPRDIEVGHDALAPPSHIKQTKKIKKEKKESYSSPTRNIFLKSINTLAILGSVTLLSLGLSGVIDTDVAIHIGEIMTALSVGLAMPSPFIESGADVSREQYLKTKNFLRKNGMK